MKQKEFFQMIKEYDQEKLAFWSEDELNEKGIDFRSTAKAMDLKLLFYAPYDNLYVGQKTWLRVYWPQEFINRGCSPRVWG